MVLEHMQTYIDMKSLRATDGNGTVSKVRRVSTTAATPSLPWKIDATEQQQQASTPRIVSMAHDVSLQRVVTGHDDGSVAIWQVDEASSNFSVLQRTPLTNGEKLLAGKKLCCVISSDIIYTLDQLLTIISIFNIFNIFQYFSVDARQGWIVYVVQSSSTNRLNLFLQSQTDPTAKPTFIATSTVDTFSGAVCLVPSVDKPRENTPSVFVGVSNGRGLQRIYCCPVSSRWLVEPALEWLHNRHVVQLHVVDQVALVVGCQRSVEFVSLRYNGGGGGVVAYGQSLPLAASPIENFDAPVVEINHYVVQASLGGQPENRVVVATQSGSFHTFSLHPDRVFRHESYVTPSTFPLVSSFAILGGSAGAARAAGAAGAVGVPTSSSPVSLCIATASGRTFALLEPEGNPHSGGDSGGGGGGGGGSSTSSTLNRMAQTSIDGDHPLLSLVEMGTSEYMAIAAKYDESFVSRGTGTRSELDIKRIWRVQNTKLWRRYETFLQNKQPRKGQGLKKGGRGGGGGSSEGLVTITSDERRLFHGTSSSVVRGILNQGFDFRLAGKHGSAHGAGVNFARESRYSLNYVKSGSDGTKKSNATWTQVPAARGGGGFRFGSSAPSSAGVFGGGVFGGYNVGSAATSMSAVSATSNDDDDDDLCCMFLARVYVGKLTKSAANLRRPPPLDPNVPTGELYDTTVDNMSNPNVHVVYDNHQAAPEYLLELNQEATKSGRGSRGGFFGSGSGAMVGSGFAGGCVCSANPCGCTARSTFNGGGGFNGTTVGSGQNQPCKFFSMQGYCKYGRNCRYSHVQHSSSSPTIRNLTLVSSVPMRSTERRMVFVGSRCLLSTLEGSGAEACGMQMQCINPVVDLVGDVGGGDAQVMHKK